MGSLPAAARRNLEIALGHAGGASLADLLDPTAGTGAASKFLLLDSDGNLTLPGTVGITGAATLSSTLGVTGAATLSSTLGVTGATTLTGGLLTDTTAPVAVETAEHGAGAIGTGVAPATYRYTRDGVIITEIQIDMTGLASVAAADDIIGLAASTPAAYIGKNVVATNGVIFRIEMICLETPATADDDINLVSGSAGDQHVDDAVTNAAVEINGGDWVAGKSVVEDVPSVAANYWFYLTCGTGGAETYSAGQFIIKLYGHPLLS